MRFLQERAEEAERANSYLDDRLKTMFSWCTSLDQLRGGARFAAFEQFLERLFQDLSHDPNNSISRHWRKLCRTFLKFYFAQGDTLKKCVAVLYTVTEGSVESASVVAKETDSRDLPSGSGSSRVDAATGPSSFVAPDAGVVCSSDPLTKSADDVRSLAIAIWKAYRPTRISVC